MADTIKTVVVEGLALANQLRDEMKLEIETLLGAGHRAPHLVVVLVGAGQENLVAIETPTPVFPPCKPNRRLFHEIDIPKPF